MAPRRLPLLNFGIEMQSRAVISANSPTYDDETPIKRWYHYGPLAVVVLLIIAPHPSLLYMLVDFHLLTLHQNISFGLHLFITYTLTFLALSSLIICVVRDPGPVPNTKSATDDVDEEDDELDLTQALMSSEHGDGPDRWCRKCWAAKPERAHHCSVCGRCVLKLDHHCPWLAHKCIGHRTYPAFIHFLTCITLLALYICVISISALLYAFRNPLAVNEITPVHELALAFAGLVITLVVGSFLCYHLYLISTNQTTLENLTPFLLLRHLPPPPQGGRSLSHPLLEPELSYDQRRLVRDAHGYIRIYDIGWRKNWAQAFGWQKKNGWVGRMLCGGSSPGDGKTFPRNPKSEELLLRLARELVKLRGDD